MTGKRVAIVGAGPSGLPAIKWCLEYGLQPFCFERTNDIGGLWRYRTDGRDGEGSVMKSTVINTSKEMTAYSDFPPPSNFANFMHHRQMLEYFRMYADHFNLLENVQFETEVMDVRRADDYEKTAKWEVTTKDSNGNVKTEQYDAVMLGSGHHADPHWPKPEFNNQQLFKGTVSHSHYFKDSHQFEDRRVVVVGIGNSGGDIAVELSKIAKQVYLVTRRGAWVVNRVGHNGWPLDTVLINRVCATILKVVPSFAQWYWQRDLSHRFDHAMYGLKPEHGLFQAHMTVNDELPNRIASGTVVVKPNIAEFSTDGTSIQFEDGSLAEDIDDVIYATGFSFGFPYLEKGKLIEVDENRVSLYKYMYKADLSHPETLCVLGLIQPLGSIMPISEMQVRVFCEALTGRLKLPSEDEMKADVQLRKKMMQEKFVTSRRHTIQVDSFDYMDHLGDMIGATPNPLDYAFSDPKLAIRLLVGPMAAYQWRLAGAKPWSGARKALMTLNNRVESGYGGTRGGPVKSSPLPWTYEMTAFLLALFCSVYCLLRMAYMELTC